MPKAAFLRAWGPNMQAASAIFLLISAIAPPVFIRSAFFGGLEGFTTFHTRVASSFFALSESATPSGSRQAATTCSFYARACTSLHGGSTFWTSPDRHHGSPLHRAAAVPLFIALPQLPSSSCHRWWKAPFEGDAQLEMAALRIAHDGFGLGFEFRAQPICIKR